MKAYLFTILAFFLCLSSFGQNSIQGRVIDQESGEPLAFVNIVSIGTTCGTASDIDGYFTLDCPRPIQQILISYIGYVTKEMPIAEGRNKITVKLEASSLSVGEVELVAGINPAHRIINKAVSNRELHNPLNYKSFTYQSYNKFVVTVDKDAVVIPDTLLTAEDSSNAEMVQFFDSKHILMMESVTERKYLKPGSDEEIVKASRVSGLQTPLFSLLATQFQSFSFHDDYITVLQEKYLNPLSKGATSRYVFEIKDTVYQDKDSVYIISFQPSVDAKFDGLKGLLYINSDRYALQNVIAEPLDQTTTKVKIQQQYQRVEGYWFPEQLNTDLDLTSVKINELSPMGIGRTYIKAVVLNPELKKGEFGSSEVVLDPNAGDRDEEFWNQYRVRPLDEKEKETYVFVDSLGKEENLERKMQLLQAITSGELPLGKLSFDLSRLLGFNQYEGFKLGGGLKTNAKMSTRLGVGGWGLYGFEDKQWKFGANAWAVVYQPKMTKIFARYRKEVVESAGMTHVFQTHRQLVGEYRYLNLNQNVDVMYQREIGVRSYLNSSTEVYVSFDNQARNPDYSYRMEGELPRAWYNFNSVHVGLKYRPKDTKMLTNFGILSLATKLPSLIIDYAYSPLAMNSSNANRLIIQADFDKRWTRIGYTKMKIQLGKSNYRAPLPFQLAGYGSMGENSFLNNVASDGSFETMGYGEIIAPGIVSTYIIHDLGPIFGKIKSIDYGVRLHAGGLYSEKLSKIHELTTAHDALKGYFETGISIRNILKSIGIGAFYRLGHYSYTDWEKNLAVKIGIAFAL